MIKVFEDNGIQMSESVLSGATDKNVFLEKVSVGLYQQKQFFIIDTDFGHETRDLQVNCSLRGDDTFKFFDIDEQTSSFDISKTNVVHVTPNRKSQYAIYTINVCMFSNDKWFSTNSTLEISFIGEAEKVYHIRMQLIGDIEPQDDRFKVALQNININFDERWIKAFKESDINEESPDYVLLNRKRAEFLEQTSELLDFNSVYYGLINAIKFFGYDDDVFIKEMWKYINKSDDMYKMVDIESTEIPNPMNFVRTNMFSLSYRLNDFADVDDVGMSFDENGVPKLIEIFTTQSDAIAKMHHMRLIIEEFFIPAHTMIYDIVGENFVLSSLNENFWLHSGGVGYFNDNLPKYDFDFNINSVVSDKFVELYNEYAPNSGRITDIAYEINETVDVNSNDINYLKKRLYRDNVATIEYKLRGIYNELSNNIQSSQINVVDLSSGNVIYTRKQYDVSRIYYNIAIRGVGEYQIQVQYVDNKGNIHTDYETISTKMTSADFDILRVDYTNGVTKYPIPTTYETLTDNNALRIGVPVFGESINGNNPQITRYVKNIVDETTLDTLTVSDLREVSVLEMLRIPITQNTKYLEIRYVFDNTWNKTLSSTISLSEKGEDYDIITLPSFNSMGLDEYEYLHQFVNIINLTKVGVFSLFSAQLERIVIDQNYPNNEYYGIRLVSNDYSSINLFNVDGNNTTVITQQIEQIGDILASVVGNIYTESLGLLTLSFENRTYHIDINVSDTVDLNTVLNNIDDAIVFSPLGDDDTKFIIYSTESFTIMHKSFGVLSDTLHKSSIPSLSAVKVGSEIGVGELIIFSVNVDKNVYRPHDISWNVYKFNTQVNGYELFKHTDTKNLTIQLLNKGQYTIELVYTDALGNEVNTTKNGCLIVK